MFIDIFEDYQNGEKFPRSRKDSGKGAPGRQWWVPPGAMRAPSSIARWWTADTKSSVLSGHARHLSTISSLPAEHDHLDRNGLVVPLSQQRLLHDLPGLFALNETPRGCAAAAPAPGQAAPPARRIAAQPAATIVPHAACRRGHRPRRAVRRFAVGHCHRYASVLGMTPEDLLALYPGLNNNPAFINPGDEILIRRPTRPRPRRKRPLATRAMRRRADLMPPRTGGGRSG